MRLPCPFCGDRAASEFTYLGDAAPQRPRLEGGPEPHDPALFVDYVYLRTNPSGLIAEYWQHTGGCRAWLVVDRNVTTHGVGSVSVARSRALARLEDRL